MAGDPIRFELPTILIPVVRSRFHDALRGVLEKRVLFPWHRKYALELQWLVKEATERLEAARRDDAEAVTFEIYEPWAAVWYWVLWESHFTANAAKTIHAEAEQRGWDLKRQRGWPRQQIRLPSS